MNKYGTVMMIRIECNQSSLFIILLSLIMVAGVSAIKTAADSNKDLDEMLLEAAGSHKIYGSHGIFMIEGLLRKGADVNTRDEDGATPLILAVSKGYESISRYLIDHGADVRQTDNSGRSPIDLAASRVDITLYQLLKRKGAETNLASAAIIGDLEQVSKLIERGAEIDKCYPPYGQTPLFASIVYNNPKVTELLLQCGANVNYTGDSGDTALVAAIANGEIGLIKGLIDRGASLRDTDNNGRSLLRFALHEATARCSALRKGYSEVADILIESGLTEDYKERQKCEDVKNEHTAGRQGDLLLSDYPKTPEDVVRAFISSSMILPYQPAKKIRECIQFKKAAYGYLPSESDRRANREKRIFDNCLSRGIDYNISLSIIKDFQVMDSRYLGKGRAKVQVKFNRCGWLNRLVVEDPFMAKLLLSGSCGAVSNPERELEYNDKIVHISMDHPLKEYYLAKSLNKWRIIGTFEPYISISSAENILKCYLKNTKQSKTRVLLQKNLIQLKNIKQNAGYGE